MKKRFIIIVGSLSVVSIIIIMVAVLRHPAPSPTASPTPSPTSQSTVPQSSNPDLPDDIKYSQAVTSLNQQFPWYQKLPIETKYYRIVYDFDKKMFRIRILSTTATSDQIKSFTQDGLTGLKNIGVAEPIKYYVLDANGDQL